MSTAAIQVGSEVMAPSMLGSRVLTVVDIYAVNGRVWLRAVWGGGSVDAPANQFVLESEVQ